MNNTFVENPHIVSWLEDGIIHACYKPHLKHLTVEIAEQMVKDRLLMTDGITRPLLVDLGNLNKTDREARKYLSEGEAMKDLSATAIIVRNQITRWLAGIYIKIDKPKIPTKFFTDKLNALVWLQQYK